MLFSLLCRRSQKGKNRKVHLFPSTSAAAAVLNTFFCPTHRNRLPSVFSAAAAAGRYRLTGRVFSFFSSHFLCLRRVCPCSSSSSTNCSQFCCFLFCSPRNKVLCQNFKHLPHQTMAGSIVFVVSAVPFPLEHVFCCC